MSERLSDYDYHLPEELIAQHPVEPRDSSRLLVIDRRTGSWTHRHFRDLGDYFSKGDLLVANNSRVIKARLLGNRLVSGELGGKIEFFMLEEKSPRVWEGLFHASAKYLAGLEFSVPTPDGKGLRGKLIRGSAESPSGSVVAEFDRDPVAAGAGELPLPKYIKREKVSLTNSEKVGLTDLESYQTVYSKELGSAAAPTAGLHFTSSLLEQLRAKGVDWAEVTLHVGVGTFRPVKTENIADHVMHEERFDIGIEAAKKVQAHRGHITAVGTTSVRTLESAFKDGEVKSGVGRTSLFIRPGHFEFQVVNRLITNFHLPKSSLLMLVGAFAGRELILDAYQEAVRQKYRFFSYGDAMLIL
jgi:S-adenosylmethionine:tRNA ribosyltransferase-isomerase